MSILDLSNGGEFSISGWVQFQTFDGKSSVLDFGNVESRQNVIVGNQSNGSAIYFSKYYANASQTISLDDFWRNEWHILRVLPMVSP